MSQLQALVDEVAEHFGTKKWEAELVPTCEDGAAFSTFLSRVSFSQTRLHTAALPYLRFQLAAEIGADMMVGRRYVREWARKALYIAWLSAFVFPIPEAGGEKFYFPKFLAIVVVAALSGYASAAAESIVDSRSKTERFLRKLLEVTHDVERTRDFLVSKKGTPEELAKFDAMVREMGLNQTQLARG